MCACSRHHVHGGVWRRSVCGKCFCASSLVSVFYVYFGRLRSGRLRTSNYFDALGRLFGVIVPLYAIDWTWDVFSRCSVFSFGLENI